METVSVHEGGGIRCKKDGSPRCDNDDGLARRLVQVYQVTGDKHNAMADPAGTPAPWNQGGCAAHVLANLVSLSGDLIP
jgi:hypothetical protein